MAENLPVGGYFLKSDQPQLSSSQENTVQGFQDLYYNRWFDAGADTINLSWFGHRILKCPTDLWMYQEILVGTRPDAIIETGTYLGGSALYLASILDLLGHGEVISIDVESDLDRPQHSRLTYLTGSSIDPGVVDNVRQRVGNGRVMVILDSDHRFEHVYQEILSYSPLVQPGDYLIVEDTNINGHPAFPGFGAGPMEAVRQFLAENEEFEVDWRCQRFMLTLNPGGYLRRIDQGSGSRRTLM